MSATVAHARVEVKKAQVRYKINFDRRIKRGNTKINVGEYLFRETQDGKGKDKLGLHTEGPFLVLHQNTRKFVVQLDYFVETVNSDPVG